jgi:hypothetical protein
MTNYQKIGYYNIEAELIDEMTRKRTKVAF